MGAGAGTVVVVWGIAGTKIVWVGAVVVVVGGTVVGSSGSTAEEGWPVERNSTMVSTAPMASRATMRLVIRPGPRVGRQLFSGSKSGARLGSDGSLRRAKNRGTRYLSQNAPRDVITARSVRTKMRRSRPTDQLAT